MGKGVLSLSLLVTALLTLIATLVHGSLARAGKVKSQTPKVDKQEKKKPPKGRAKKRILYNRRWVDFLNPDHSVVDSHQLRQCDDSPWRQTENVSGISISVAVPRVAVFLQPRILLPDDIAASSHSSR